MWLSLFIGLKTIKLQNIHEYMNLCIIEFCILYFLYAALWCMRFIKV